MESFIQVTKNTRTTYFLLNFFTKKNLTHTRKLIRSHHAGHRVAPRHGQSGPEWGHGVNRRQRRTYRTFFYVYVYFSLSLSRMLFFVVTLFFPRGGGSSSLSLAAVKTDRTCDVSFSFFYSRSLFCGALSRASASKPSSRARVVTLSCSLFSNALLSR